MSPPISTCWRNEILWWKHLTNGDYSNTDLPYSPWYSFSAGIHSPRRQLSLLLNRLILYQLFHGCTDLVGGMAPGGQSQKATPHGDWCSLLSPWAVFEPFGVSTLCEFPKIPQRTGAAGEQLPRDQPHPAGSQQWEGELDSRSVVWVVVVSWGVSPLHGNIRIYCVHKAERAQERPALHKIHGPSADLTSDLSRQGSRAPCYISHSVDWEPACPSVLMPAAWCSLVLSSLPAHPLSSSLPGVSRTEFCLLSQETWI